MHTIYCFVFSTTSFARAVSIIRARLYEMQWPWTLRRSNFFFSRVLVDGNTRPTSWRFSMSCWDRNSESSLNLYLVLEPNPNSKILLRVNASWFTILYLCKSFGREMFYSSSHNTSNQRIKFHMHVIYCAAQWYWTFDSRTFLNL